MVLPRVIRVLLVSSALFYADIIRAYYGPLGNCDSIKAEAMALLLGLREMRRLDMA